MMPHFWKQIQAVEETGKGDYPPGMDDLIMCYEMKWLFTDYMEQPDWWRANMLQFRAKKIIGENTRNKRAKRLAGKTGKRK